MKNNNEIIGGITFLFILVGTLMPIITHDFNTTYSGTKSETITGNVGQSITPNDDTLSFWDFVKSILGMFFFTFGGINFFIDTLVLVPIRIMYYYCIIDKIRKHGS